MVTMTTVNSALWTAFNAGPTDVVTATDVATVTVALPVPAIADQDGGDRSAGMCDDGGGVPALWRRRGDVLLLVENTGDVALVLHDLEDSELGTILNDLPYTLAPNASIFITQTAMVTMTTVNSALWTAFNAGPTDVVTATDVATVTVALPVPAIVLTKDGGHHAWRLRDDGRHFCSGRDDSVLLLPGGEHRQCALRLP